MSLSTTSASSLKAQFAARNLDWILPEWPAPLRVHAFMTTRRGQRNRVMNLDSASADFAASRQELDDFIPNEPRWLTQAHGTTIVDLDADDETARNTARAESDGSITRIAGTVCAVLSADCLPLLLTDRHGSVVGAVHAGWRGLATGVVEAAIVAMDIDPSKIMAWLGPAIGPAAFEVGADVRGAFCATDADAAACFMERGKNKWNADLYALARRRLAHAGVEAVFGGDRCTMSEPRYFYSYRRGRDSGRMAALIWLDD